MKKMNICRLSLLLALIFSALIKADADPVNLKMARTIAGNKIRLQNQEAGYRVSGSEAIAGRNGNTLYYLFHLVPVGYIVVSCDSDLPPIIAYSYSSSFYDPSDDKMLLRNLLIRDISFRLENAPNLPSAVLEKRHAAWKKLLSGVYDPKESRDFQQWPAPGTTSTGGWIETQWKQGNPYNIYCPMDPVTELRSLAGCPAVAMAMILNYHKTTHDTHFSDADDYYHSYAGRQYWIDDDHSIVDFPSWPALNTLLDTLSSHYQHEVTPTTDDKAALIFACGVAAHQVYTSSISGTFGIQYAHQAFQKFQFGTASLLWAADTSLFPRLISNMKDGLPAQVAVNDEGGTVGHNVVVDGYNTDNYFHVNFGWGGSYDGWYLLPEEFPYGLTVLKGVVLDIGMYQGITLDIRVYLEGPFNGSSMNTYLNSYLPLLQPYNSPPWNYSGNESVASVPNPDIVDWVLVELRETSGGPQNALPTTSIATQACFLLNDGHITGLNGSGPVQFPVVISQELYCIVWHRNHLGVLSASELTSPNNNYTYDFTNSQTKAYGGYLGCTQLAGGYWGMAGGDGNADGQTNNSDKNDIWSPSAGNFGYLPGDFNMDIQINNTDKNEVWKPNTGLGCQVP